MVEIIIVSILLFISAISKAIQDTLSFHVERSVFPDNSWWNPIKSWENKYTWFSKSKLLTWLISNPLVVITDAWHLFGFIRDFCIFACIPIISKNYWLFFAYPLYRLVFHIFFTYIFIHGKNQKTK